MFDHQTIDRFSGVVESIYAAACAPQQWPDAVGRIAQLHGSDKALLFTPALAPEQGGFAFPHGIGEAEMLDWGTRYIQHDLWTREGLLRGLHAGNVVLDTDLVPDEELLESVFYREFLSRQDIRRLCSGMVFDAHGDDAPVTGCSVFGRHGAEVFGERNRLLHRLVLNHLSRSLGTMLRLRDAELRLASTLAALDRLRGGVLLLGARGQVLFVNAVAQSIIDARDGIALRPVASDVPGLGWLVTDSAGVTDMLQREVAALLAADPLTARHFSHCLKLPRLSGRRELVLHLAPLADSSALAHADRHAHAIAFLTDPEHGIAIDEGMLERLYRITPAEARLARALAAGDSLPDIACHLGLSPHTLKKQLQALFAKTRTNRQAELVRLLMSLSAGA